MRLPRFSIAVVTLVAVVMGAQLGYVEPAAPVPPWKDPTLSIEQRLDDLLSRLKPGDLVSQLSNSAAPFLDQARFADPASCLLCPKSSEVVVLVNHGAFKFSVIFSEPRPQTGRTLPGSRLTTRSQV